MISKYKALQELINIQPALGQQKLKSMLRILEEGQVTEGELERILTYDYRGKTEEQTELYETLVGLVIDLYIQNNGQEQFLILYNKVEKGKEPQNKESESAIIIPKYDNNIQQVVRPRKKIDLGAHRPKKQEQVKEVQEQPKEVQQQPKAEPYVAPETKEVETNEFERVSELKEEVIYKEPEVVTTRKEEVVMTREPEVEEFEDFDDYEEEEQPKKGGVLKYLAVGLPAILLVGGLVYWQVNDTNNRNSQTEQEVAKILQEMPKENKKGAGLSSSEYDENIKILTQGIDSIKQNDKTGLSGYLVVEGEKYIIQKYDQSSGSLTVFDNKGEKTVFDEDWVQKLVERSKEGKTKLPDSSSNGEKKEAETKTTTEGGN